MTTALIGCFSNSPIINNALLFATAYSKTVCIFLTVAIGDETSSTNGFSNVTFCLATSVIKLGFANPWFIWEPVTISTDVSSDFESVSINTTPFLPTFLNAFAIIPPSSVSLLDDIDATWSIMSPSTGIDTLSKYLIVFSYESLISFLTSLKEPSVKSSMATFCLPRLLLS